MLTHPPSEFAFFSRQILRRPREVSALAPSSPSLARMMARQLPLTAARVAEFGPGTGSITREILRAGIGPGALTLFEVNETFCRRLGASLPGVQVVNAPAQELSAHVPGDLDAVISGLPLLSMPRDVQRAILSAAFRGLAPEGIYIQFTYGVLPPVRTAVARELGLAFTRTARVWNNLPPATVYVYRRERPANPAPAPPSALGGSSNISAKRASSDRSPSSVSTPSRSSRSSGAKP